MPNPEILRFCAVAQGVNRMPGGQVSFCAQCGPNSPFETWGTVKKLGRLFGGHQWLFAPDIDTICVGCKKILGGRPGGKERPLRTYSWKLVPGLDFEWMSIDAWWHELHNPPTEPTIYSWAQSKKKHHVLHAGFSCNGDWRVGADETQIRFRHNAQVLESVLTLRRFGCGKAEIVTGRYHTSKWAQMNALLTEHEEILRPFRDQTPEALDLIVFAIPKQPNSNKSDYQMPLKTIDRQAVELLAQIAYHSTARVLDGKKFWGGWYLNRIRRFMRLPLNDFVSRLMGEFNVGVQCESSVIVERMSAEESDELGRAIRERTDLLHGLAFRQMSVYREERKLEKERKLEATIDNQT